MSDSCILIVFVLTLLVAGSGAFVFKPMDNAAGPSPFPSPPTVADLNGLIGAVGQLQTFTSGGGSNSPTFSGSAVYNGSANVMTTSMLRANSARLYQGPKDSKLSFTGCAYFPSVPQAGSAAYAPFDTVDMCYCTGLSYQTSLSSSVVSGVSNVSTNGVYIQTQDCLGNMKTVTCAGSDGSRDVLCFTVAPTGAAPAPRPVGASASGAPGSVTATPGLNTTMTINSSAIRLETGMLATVFVGVTLTVLY